MDLDSIGGRWHGWVRNVFNQSMTHLHHPCDHEIAAACMFVICAHFLNHTVTDCMAIAVIDVLKSSTSMKSWRAPAVDCPFHAVHDALQTPGIGTVWKSREFRVVG